MFTECRIYQHSLQNPSRSLPAYLNLIPHGLINTPHPLYSRT
eukprot:UN01456